MTISAVIQNRLRDAEWDAEIARESGDTGAMLDAIAAAEELRTQQARLGEAEWLKAQETEM